MSLSAEDVKRQLATYEEMRAIGARTPMPLASVVAAARAWLASQEQTPDRRWWCEEHGQSRSSEVDELLCWSYMDFGDCRMVEMLLVPPESPEDT